MAKRTLADIGIDTQKAMAAKEAALKKPTVLQDTINDLVMSVKETLFDEKHRLMFLAAFGVGNEASEGYYYTCSKCGRVLRKEDFYVSTELNMRSCVTPVCKECATSVAVPSKNGGVANCTKETVQAALELLRKPYLDTVWDSAILEAANTASGIRRTSVWSTYIKTISMPPYYGMTYSKNSDFYVGTNAIAPDDGSVSRDQEILDAFEKNKNDTLRLLGYLPFEKEKIADQPFLYAQLIGFLDASPDGNDDMMRVSSIISIVRAFLQQNQIDDMIANLVQDTRNAERNVATIKALQDMKKNVTITITKLAQESCISLKNTKNAKKGENTWTGKIKKIKDLNLREGEINGFSLATCKGMRQVIEMSDASIMKQLALDESEWSDMVAEQREIITQLRDERDGYQEISRILLRENLDLKDVLDSNHIDISKDLVDLKDLYSPFRSDHDDNDDVDYMDYDQEPEEDIEKTDDTGGASIGETSN